MKLKNRIDKYKDSLTNVQKYIGQKLLNLDPHTLQQISIDNLSKKINVSRTTLYSFIKKIGFKNIYEFRMFLKEKNINKSRLAMELDLTINKLNEINVQTIIQDIKLVDEIVILSKGFSVALSRILRLKLRKNGYFVHEIIGNSGLDLLVKNKKYFVIYISISSRFINNLSNELKDLLNNYPNLLITHSRPIKQKVDYFKYILHGNVLYDYSRAEFENPENTLIITLQVIN